MITLKDLNLIINHLHHANEIFDIEALLEERKHTVSKVILDRDLRNHSLPRSVILRNKAEQVCTLEKKLLEECNCLKLSLEEDTIYAARELIAESVYPWINRKEPQEQCIDEIMSDETFISYSKDLTEKKKKLLASPLSLLSLPFYIEKELTIYFTAKKSKTKKDVTTTVADIFSFGIHNLSLVFLSNKEYKTKLITFRLHILGLLEESSASHPTITLSPPLHANQSQT